MAEVDVELKDFRCWIQASPNPIGQGHLLDLWLLERYDEKQQMYIFKNKKTQLRYKCPFGSLAVLIRQRRLFPAVLQTKHLGLVNLPPGPRAS